jgi:hypothetical protein
MSGPEAARNRAQPQAPAPLIPALSGGPGRPPPRNPPFPGNSQATQGGPPPPSAGPGFGLWGATGSGPAGGTAPSLRSDARAPSAPKDTLPTRGGLAYSQAGEKPLTLPLPAGDREGMDSRPAPATAFPETPAAGSPAHSGRGGTLSDPGRLPHRTSVSPRPGPAAPLPPAFAWPPGREPERPAAHEGFSRMRLVSNRADLTALLRAEISPESAGAGPREETRSHARPLAPPGPPAPAGAGPGTSPPIGPPGAFDRSSDPGAAPFPASAWAEEAWVDRLLEKLEDRMRDESLRRYGLTGGSV